MMGATGPAQPGPRNLAAALAHAAAGRPVFPCSPKDKRPAIPKRDGGKGFKDATTDAATIRGWWARYPDAVPGMPTGARVGVWVLDIDTKPGKVGDETLRQLESAFGRLPETVETITATGGRHLFFRHPRDGREIPNRAGQLGIGTETWGRDGYPDVPFARTEAGKLRTPDVDVRGDGGYVILPGAVMRDGRAYEWEASSDPEEGARVADAPPWLLALVVVDPSAQPAPGPAPAEGEPVAEGGRNDFLYRLGCSLRAKGLGEAAIVAALLAENQARCRPPLPEGEVVASAKSAASKAPGISPEYEARRRQRQEQPPAQGARAGRPDLRVVAGTEHDDRPVIRIVAGDLPYNADDAETALLEQGADLYQHGNRLVRVGSWEGAEGPVRRPTGAGVLIDISPEWLVDDLTRRIRWERYDKRKDEWVRTDAPTKIAKTMLSRTGSWRFSHLLGFSDSPTLTLDGRLVSRPGYDAGSGLYLTNPPEIADLGTPGLREAQKACEVLYELVSTFPFSRREDRSAALAILMTGVLRRVLPAAPIGCISASTPGTGKSLFADCASTLVTGRKASAVALGKDGEELEKRLDSVLLKGDALCVFDNVDRAVKSDVLCQVTTQAHKSVRFLGQSRIVEAPTNVTLLMTGNNLTLIGDLTRRAVLMHLDAGCERPERREFQRDAIEHILRFRAEGIRAALTISKAYLAAGAPRVKSTPFGSFEDWDRLIRRPLIWCGWADPLASAESLREQDHEFVGMADLLEAWQEAFGEQAVTAADLHEAIVERDPGYAGDRYAYPALADAAQVVLGDLRKWGVQELGYRLRQWNDRIIDGRKVTKTGKKSKRGVLWVVETVTG